MLTKYFVNVECYLLKLMLNCYAVWTQLNTFNIEQCGDCALSVHITVGLHACIRIVSRQFGFISGLLWILDEGLVHAPDSFPGGAIDIEDRIEEERNWLWGLVNGAICLEAARKIHIYVT